MKSKTNISVRDNNGARITSNMNIGPSKGFRSGDMLDANATAQLVDDRISDLVGGAEETLDTLKEISTAIPTKISQLTNDVGFITSTEASDISFSGNYDDLSNKPALATVATSGSYDDLDNKPTIPDISGKLDIISDLNTIRDGANAGATAYQKPQDGIPTSDLTNSAATALNNIMTVDEVWSAAIADIYNEILGIKTRFNNLGTTSAVEINFENLPKVNGYSVVSTGSGAPTDVPHFIGLFYIDNTTPALYCAKTITNSTGDWFQV